jgi:steroid delta-isomerase
VKSSRVSIIHSQGGTTLTNPLIVQTAGIRWKASRSAHPARVASWRAIDAITRSDKERYISLYAPDGVIHDPVGKSAVDPTGEGHRGHAALARFWDSQIATAGDLSFVVHTSVANDDQVANSFSMVMQLPTGDTRSMECIFIYRVNEAGLLLRVAGYWEVASDSGSGEDLARSTAVTRC